MSVSVTEGRARQHAYVRERVRERVSQSVLCNVISTGQTVLIILCSRTHICESDSHHSKAFSPS